MKNSARRNVLFTLRLCLLISVASLLTACATGYHSMGLTGGYKDKVLDPNTIQITYKGNGASKSQQIYKFAMRRAAQVTKLKGYNYFLVLSNKSYLKPESFTNVQGITFNTECPVTVLKIRLLTNKVAGAYSVNKVWLMTDKKSN